MDPDLDAANSYQDRASISLDFSVRNEVEVSKKPRASSRKGGEKRRKKKIREVDIAPPSASPMSKNNAFFSPTFIDSPIRRELNESFSDSPTTTDDIETSSDGDREFLGLGYN